MQLVYLSNRPEVLRDTLDTVRRFMPFVDDIVAVIPQRDKDVFGSIGQEHGVSFLFDESLTQQDLGKLDHQTRDYLLRTSLSGIGDIAEEFIMSDDDYRPLEVLDSSFFKEEDRYHSYFCYDLKEWTHGSNAFDVGQQDTYQLLKYLKFPLLSYASHMPQIINKRILLESQQTFAPFIERLALCEWSTYFNFAHMSYPDVFHSPRPYKTLCWPDCVTCWPRMVDPDEYVFENYSPHLYQAGGPFQQVTSDTPYEDIKLQKIINWSRYELRVLQGKALDNPTPLRRLAYLVIRPLRRLKDVLWFDERKQLLQLSRRLAEIETIVAKQNKN